jgi:hypothetical protein
MMVQIEQLLVVTRHHAKQTGRQALQGAKRGQVLHYDNFILKL